MDVIIERPCKISVQDQQLEIVSPDCEKSIPVEDLDCVVIENQAVNLTVPAMVTLSERGIALIVCNAGHQPECMMGSLFSQSVQTERLSRQVRLSDKAKDSLWKETVIRKILNQDAALKALSLPESRLVSFAETVEPGDAANREGAAAGMYWKALFGRSFKRERFGPEPNPMLNYGYAILRGAMARAICAAGLSPCFGLHHKNRYDDFPLADDLMEPFRPTVDRIVYDAIRDGVTVSDKDIRRQLVANLETKVKMEGKSVSVKEAMRREACSLAQFCNNPDTRLLLPTL